MGRFADKARGLRRKIEALASEHVKDEEAVECVELFPNWDGENHEYSVGDRFKNDGKLYKVLQPHTSQLEWVPSVAPSVYAEILPGQDGTEIGEWVQPDSTNPYMTGDRVTYDGKVWESTVDNNVWAPGVYGWLEVTD